MNHDLSKTRHELRTPINHIIGYCEMLLEEGNLPESLGRDLEKMRSGGKRLLELISLHLNESTIGDSRNLQNLQHELRTPVNHIIGYAELLMEQAVENGQNHLVPDLERISQAAGQWLDLMEEHLIPAEITTDPGFSPAASQAPSLAFVTPAISFHTSPPRAREAAAHWKANILVVEDDPATRDLLKRRLIRYGATVTAAEDGMRALQLLRRNHFELVLLDLLLPGLDGYQVLVKAKSDPKLRDIPIILISGLDQENGIARCLEAGAEDYLTKPFNAIFLKARIGACLEKKHWRDQERATYQALVASQQRLADELAEAAGYVRSLMPAPIEGDLTVRWRFQPSAELGGDIFGYHWIDQERLSIYLLDVSGHGVGAALLSVSLLNVLRAQSLAETDFGDPAQVLRHLNRVFPMESQNNLLFTIWYGVYHKARRELSFASGGHPPAILMDPRKPGPQNLTTKGRVLGCDPQAEYRAETCSITPGTRLYVFSDGVYEIQDAKGQTRQWSDLVEQLSRVGSEKGRVLDEIINWTESLRGNNPLEDDLSIMEFEF